MRARVLGLVLALVAALTVMVGAPAQATTCHTFTRTISYEDRWDDITVHFDDLYRARLVGSVCGTHRYLDGYKRSVTKYGSVNCGAGDVDWYRLNVSPITGVDPPPVTWSCHNGQKTYSSWYPIHKRFSGSDRCFNLTWRRGMTLHRDSMGSSLSACI